MIAVLTTVTAITLGCSSGNNSTTEPKGTGTDRGSTDTTDSSADGRVNGPLKLRLDRIDVGLESPIAAVQTPKGNGLVVAERGGTVRVLDLSDSTPKLSDPVIDISVDTSTDAERGLLGIAFNPSADRLLLSYTNRDGNTRLKSYGASWTGSSSSDVGTLKVEQDSGVVLLEVRQPYANHNGGHIELGPDGMLYMGLGDGGAAGDPHGNGQNTSTLLGKMLRLNPDATDRSDVVPDDNPFERTAGTAHEIWSIGLRNPWGFSFDPTSGDLWIADVGQDTFEEINRVAKADDWGRGANFGWSLYEGLEPFEGSGGSSPDVDSDDLVKPVFVYRHDPGCSVTGGVVYRGDKIGGLVGHYLYSDYCDGTMRSLSGPDNGDVADGGSLTSTDLGISTDQVAGFATGSDGEVYVISLRDGLMRISEGQ